LASNLTSPPGTQFFCPRSSAFQPSELSQSHRMWIFSSLRHALEPARALPRENINEFAVLLRFSAEQSRGARPRRVKNARLRAPA
jgi:alpha-ketoglutarate-dependent taurine dioxygenase